MSFFQEKISRMLPDCSGGGRSGQVLTEYGILLWFITFAGAASLMTFIFAFEGSIIDYYESIVHLIALPIP
jgi:hypothetical protein